MTIAFVIEKLRGGGAERITAALANEFCKNEPNEIHIIVFSRQPDIDYSTDPRLHWHVLSDTSGGRWKKIASKYFFLRNTIHKIAPQCVISLAIPRTTALLVLSMLGQRIPLILSERNDPEQFPTTKIWRKIRDLTYKIADGVVFQTEDARDHFTKNIKSKSAVISNPITASLPVPYTGQRNQRIVNFCRLVPQKNLDLLIDSFSDISAELSDYILEIYGDGPEKKRLEDKVRMLNLDHRVVFRGHSEHIYEDIHQAALFVSSSDYEGISNSMLEAIAMGIPTICTDCPAGGARQTINNGNNGILVPVRDRKALSAAMKNVLNDKKMCEDLSKAGSRLREELSVEVIAKKWLDFVVKTMKA